MVVRALPVERDFVADAPDRLQVADTVVTVSGRLRRGSRQRSGPAATAWPCSPSSTAAAVRHPSSRTALGTEWSRSIEPSVPRTKLSHIIVLTPSRTHAG